MATENDCQKAFERCKVVLLDVAGTTTSTTFVKDTLFQFVTEHIESFLQSNWENEEIKAALKVLNEDKDVLEIVEAVNLVKSAIEKESKNIGLKTISGLVFNKGYIDGTLKAHLYSDVPVAFLVWSKERKIAIYSSGSVESQKLLFQHSIEGDLSSHVSNYFDQSVGLKTIKDSYLKIASELKVPAEEVLFISDLKEELIAAKEAGLLTILINREKDQDTESDFPRISSFAELIVDNSSNKRKNEDDNESKEEPPCKLLKKGTDEQSQELEIQEKAVEKKETQPVAEPMEVVEIPDPAPEVAAPSVLITVSDTDKIETDELKDSVDTKTDVEENTISIETEVEIIKPTECESIVKDETVDTKCIADNATVEITKDVVIETEEIKPSEEANESSLVIEPSSESTNNIDKIEENSENTITESSAITMEPIVNETLTADVEKDSEKKSIENGEVEIDQKPEIPNTENGASNVEEQVTVKGDNMVEEAVKNVEEVEVTETKLTESNVVCDDIVAVAAIEEPKCDIEESKKSTIEESKKSTIEDNIIDASNTEVDKIAEPTNDETLSKTVAEPAVDLPEAILNDDKPIVKESSTTIENIVSSDPEVSPMTESLSNGKEVNGKSEDTADPIEAPITVTNGQSNGETTDTGDEVKIKKMDKNAEATAVSIEV